MLAAVLLLVAAPDPPPPAGVCLADARRFAAVPPLVARANWRLAAAHPDLMGPAVAAWNPPAVAAAWAAECDWRRQCWSLLDDVLYCDYPPALKLDCLRRLRAALGEEAYASGVMPAPICEYRP